MNAGTLLDFFNQLSKTPGPGGFCESIEKVISFGLLEFDKKRLWFILYHSPYYFCILIQVSVKEEPLSEEDLRAVQKDRQKKDNHNMSKLKMIDPYLYFVLYLIMETTHIMAHMHFLIGLIYFQLKDEEDSISTIESKN